MKPQLSSPGWELQALDLISYGPIVAKRTTQHSISYTVSAFVQHYWNGLDEPSMVLSIAEMEPDAGDGALITPGDASCCGKPWFSWEHTLSVRVLEWKKLETFGSGIYILGSCYRWSALSATQSQEMWGAAFLFFTFGADQPEYLHLSRFRILPTIEGKYWCTFSIQSHLPGICLSLKLAQELCIIFGKKRKVRKELLVKGTIQLTGQLFCIHKIEKNFPWLLFTE